MHTPSVIALSLPCSLHILPPSPAETPSLFAPTPQAGGQSAKSGFTLDPLDLTTSPTLKVGTIEQLEGQVGIFCRLQGPKKILLADLEPQGFC